MFLISYSISEKGWKGTDHERTGRNREQATSMVLAAVETREKTRGIAANWRFSSDWSAFYCLFFFSYFCNQKLSVALSGSVLDSPVPCTHKVSARGSSLFQTVTKLWRLYTFVLPRLYGRSGSDWGRAFHLSSPLCLFLAVLTRFWRTWYLSTQPNTLHTKKW